MSKITVFSVVEVIEGAPYITNFLTRSAARDHFKSVLTEQFGGEADEVDDYAEEIARAVEHETYIGDDYSVSVTETDLIGTPTDFRRAAIRFAAAL